MKSFSPWLLMVLLIVNASVVNAAQGPAFTSKTIPTNNSFQHDFDVRNPGDALVVTVSPDPQFEMRNGRINGGAPIWVGLGNFVASGIMPANQAGNHDGTFIGEFRKTGRSNGGGNGGDPWKQWDGKALAKVVTIEHTTLLLAADDVTPNSRSTVGVFEMVRLRTIPSTSATWTISGGVPRTATGDTILWTAPETAQSVSITATFANGVTATASLNVIAPASVTYTRIGTPTIPSGTAGALMQLNLDLNPDTVTFANLMVREGTGGQGTVTGYFALDPGWLAITVHPIGAWIGVTRNNVYQGIDTSGITNIPPPWAAGTITQPIPNEYRGINEPASTARNINTTIWSGELLDNGTFTITKGSATYTRSP